MEVGSGLRQQLDSTMRTTRVRVGGDMSQPQQQQQPQLEDENEDEDDEDEDDEQSSTPTPSLRRSPPPPPPLLPPLSALRRHTPPFRHPIAAAAGPISSLAAPAPTYQLPSIRSLEAVASMESHPQYPVQYHDHHSTTAATHLPVSYQPLPNVYQNSGNPLTSPSVPAIAPNGQPAAMRIPIAQAALATPAMRRPDKDIKRRTKTGCLTCRKRRIKCDETHPECRNCHKSKRPCLGYDPIFKQQQPSPQELRPAPISDIHAQAPYHIPPGQGTAAFYPGASPRHPVGNGTFEPIGPPLDHNLSRTNIAPVMAQAPDDQALQPARTVKLISVEQLFALQGTPPEYQTNAVPPSMSPTTQQEVQEFYQHHYAAGLDSFFETNWYSRYGPAHLQQDLSLRDFVAQCAEQYRAQDADPSRFRSIQSLEARLVWLLATMPRTVWRDANSEPKSSIPPDLLHRIDTVEHLLTGQFLPPDRIPAAPPSIDRQSPVYHELVFWSHLGRFTASRDDTPDPAVSQWIIESLDGMRSTLLSLESRDVLYSIAVARHYGGKLPNFDRQRYLFHMIPNTNSDVGKLAVAADLIVREDQRGMTQVVQTMCRMAMRSWALQ